MVFYSDGIGSIKKIQYSDASIAKVLYNTKYNINIIIYIINERNNQNKKKVITVFVIKSSQTHFEKCTTLTIYINFENKYLLNYS